MKVLKKQSNSHDCIICGVDNPYGVHASFYEMEDGSLISLFHFDSRHQSYPARTHGGMIAAMIDECIGRAIWISDPTLWGVTLKLEIEYHQAVPYDVPLKCIARIEKQDAISFHGSAEIRDQSNRLLARGQALYMKISLEKITENNAKGHPEDVNVMVKDDVREIN
jgi:uncharacterized protein (TIGR00369 family)